MTEPPDPPQVGLPPREADEDVPLVVPQPAEVDPELPVTEAQPAASEAEQPRAETAGSVTEVLDPGADGAGPPPTHPPPEAGGAEPAGRRDGGTGVARNVVEWLTILGGALVVALVVTRFLVQAFFIPSLSMYPALEEGDRVLVNKLSYRLHEIHRGDLIVFERPSDEGPGQVKDLIKRVVALGGERVEARGGEVFVDGEQLPEPYLAPDVGTADFEPVVVPDGHVFVMGDNRDDSRDSRFFGPLPEDLVIGRAFVKVWPLDDLELL